MKAEDKLVVGDKVKVNDGSWSVRVDSYHKHSDLHGICQDTFEVVHIIHDSDCGCLSCIRKEETVHDIFIMNLSNKHIYLHSASMVSLVKPEIKEITMAEREEKYGCKVKIVKD